MEPQAQPQQQTPTITTEGLNALYRQFGEYAHVGFEAQAQLQHARALLRQAMEQYGPKPEDAAPAESDAPTPIAPIRPRKPAAPDPAAETGA